MFMRALQIVCLLPLFAHPVAAQTPPSSAERAAYTGLLGVTASGWHNEMVQLLVNGLDPNVRDAAGRTPYLVAAHNGDLRAMEILARNGADTRALDNQRYDAVTILAVANRPEAMARALALGGDPRAITSPYAGTALIAAAHLGHHEVVAILVRAGAPLDHVNNLGWTALIEAVILGNGGADHQRTVAVLLDAGASTQLADKQGVTPLQHARARGYAEITRLLEAKGAR